MKTVDLTKLSEIIISTPILSSVMSPLEEGMFVLIHENEHMEGFDPVILGRIESISPIKITSVHSYKWGHHLRLFDILKNPSQYDEELYLIEVGNSIGELSNWKTENAPTVSEKVNPDIKGKVFMSNDRIEYLVVDVSESTATCLILPDIDNHVELSIDEIKNLFKGYININV